MYELQGMVVLYRQEGTSMMRTRLIINLQVEGLHYWKDAKIKKPEVGFLSHPHRHIFHIQLTMEVNDLDREIEFIDFKHNVLEYMNNKWGCQDMCDFKGMSCEMIAKDLLENFHAKKVRVMEDGENGAEVEV